VIRLVLLLVVALVGSSGLRAEEMAVSVDNRSKPTACAEEDNVYLRLQSPQVRHFLIEAVHPTYIASLKADNDAPDFNGCDFAKPAALPPPPKFTPRKVSLYRDANMELIGFTFADFWRTNIVSVRVGSREENNIHLLQLWLRVDEQFEEVLVLYPTDGYWRARPLTPANLSARSAYGSSFLIGPIEEQERPLVDVKDVLFDPAARAFTLHFAKGGEGRLQVVALDRQHIALDVTLDHVISETPFAAVRSMFVSQDNADISRVSWRGRDGVLQSSSVLDFKNALAIELHAERVVASRHNTSAPDLVFRDFTAASNR
jgi:hypothetical protein